MRARVKANSPFPAVRACVGRDFVRGGWTELPDDFLEEIGNNPYLEIEQVSSVEPDELEELIKPRQGEQTTPHGPNFDVVLAGNAVAVKGFIDSMQSKSDLKKMKHAESKGKARKGVLDAIDDRLTEVEGD